MRAIRLHEFGGPLTIEEVDEPVGADGEVAIDMLYAAVNPLDVWTCQGNFAAITPLPHTPGVEGLGRDLFGVPGIVHGAGIGIARPGTYAQRIVVPSASWMPLAQIDDLPGVDAPAVAASASVAGVTAWNCVHDVVDVKAGDTVLVLGASGGVGSLATQMCRTLGAHVIGQSSSAAKADTVAANGAHDVVVAGNGEELVAAVAERRLDVVIDGLGGTFTAGAISCMAPFGRIVNYGTSAGVEVTLQMRNLYRNGISLSGYTGLLQTHEHLTATLAKVMSALHAGDLKIPIDEILPLEGAQRAHQRILDRQVEGKLVLDVNA